MNVSSMNVARSVCRTAITMASSMGELGSGVGKSGGGGGSIREAGGAFGKLEAAREEEYFYHLQKAQLKGLKQQLQEEIEHHEDLIRKHQEVLTRHQQRVAELEKESSTIHL